MRAVAYVRVSTEEQATEGISLEAQNHRVRAYCELRGLELVDIITDAGVSAGKPLARRDGGARLLHLIRRGEAVAVVAFKLDRLFRNCADCLTVTATWDRSGVALHLIDLGGQAVDTSTAMGRFFLTVMAGAAEMERGLVAEPAFLVCPRLGLRSFRELLVVQPLELDATVLGATCLGGIVRDRLARTVPLGGHA